MMRAYVLGGALLLAVMACASHPPRCGGRLSPINRQSVRQEFSSGARWAAAQSGKAARS